MCLSRAKLFAPYAFLSLTIKQGSWTHATYYVILSTCFHKKCGSIYSETKQNLVLALMENEQSANVFGPKVKFTLAHDKYLRKSSPFLNFTSEDFQI